MRFLSEHVRYCHSCGNASSAYSFFCRNCRALLKPLFSPSLALVAIALDVAIWHVFSWRIAPFMAEAFEGVGAALPLLIQFVVSLSRWYSRWFWLPYPPAVLLLLLSYLYRPAKNLYAPLLVALSLLLTLSIAFIFLVALATLASSWPVIT